MNLSPYQLISSHFEKILVEQTNSEDESRKPFDEFEIQHFVKITRIPQENDMDGLRVYVVALGLRTGEEPPKNIPYAFEIVNVGTLVSNGKAGNVESEVDDGAARYGFSLLLGQIRETLASTTSRMQNGTFLIPTIDFREAKYSELADGVELKENKSSTPDKIDSSSDSGEA